MLTLGWCGDGSVPPVLLVPAGKRPFSQEQPTTAVSPGPLGARPHPTCCQRRASLPSCREREEPGEAAGSRAEPRGQRRNPPPFIYLAR